MSGQTDNPSFEFDGWAETYDQSVLNQMAFPFTGYSEVLRTILRLAEPRPGMRVLDLGTGTGNLAQLFDLPGCELWCTDFSEAMLTKARGKLPSAHLLLHNLREPLPTEFDLVYARIVSAYVFHHINTGEKIRILKWLASRNLSPTGRMVIGDIAFLNAAERDEVKRETGEGWEEECYWLADEARSALEKEGLKVEYTQVSSCAGVFVILPWTYEAREE